MNTLIALLDSRLRTLWLNNSKIIMLIALAAMSVFAFPKLGVEFARLLFDPTRNGAVDLKYYSDWTHAWFTGAPFYARPEHPEYPPASMPILWTIAGWFSFEQARWVWALLFIAALVAISWASVRVSGAQTWVERAFIALLFLSMNGTAVTIGNGQLILFLLPITTAAIWLLYRRPNGTLHNLVAALALLFALSKPSLTVPFFWLALWAPRGFRIVSAVGLGYLVLTFFAAAFQPGDVISLGRAALENGARIAVGTLDGNIHFILGYLGYDTLILPASLAAFIALGWWTWKYRAADPIVLLSVAALVARLWTYHRVYEDVLLLVPEIALYQIAKRDANGIAGILLALNIIALLPIPGLNTMPHLAEILSVGAQLGVTVADLIFFLAYPLQNKIALFSRISDESPIRSG